MSLTRAAIEKNRITSVVLIVILFAGISAFNGLPRNEDPGFIIRAAQVMTFFPGAGPERIEMLITDKLEKAIQEMPEIDFINRPYEPKRLEAFFTQTQDFIDCLRQNRPPSVTGKDGRSAIEMIEASHFSSLTGNATDLPLPRSARGFQLSTARDSGERSAG